MTHTQRHPHSALTLCYRSTCNDGRAPTAALTPYVSRVAWRAGFHDVGPTLQVEGRQTNSEKTRQNSHGKNHVSALAGSASAARVRRPGHPLSKRPCRFHQPRAMPSRRRERQRATLTRDVGCARARADFREDAYGQDDHAGGRGLRLASRAVPQGSPVLTIPRALRLARARL